MAIRLQRVRECGGGGCRAPVRPIPMLFPNFQNVHRPKDERTTNLPEQTRSWRKRRKRRVVWN